MVLDIYGTQLLTTCLPYATHFSTRRIRELTGKPLRQSTDDHREPAPLK